jgi:hypothetical protein
MLPNPNERRAMRRFDMRLPAIVKLEGSEQDEVITETQNVSARGIFFFLDHAPTTGSKVEMTVTFPPHVTLTEPMRVRFVARVIRVEEAESASRVGVAAMIEAHEFLSSQTSANFLTSLQ